MGEKRPADSELDGDQPVRKPRFNGSSNASKRHGQGVDETYGQRFAFGNLNAATIPKDEDLEWEDESDALAYLKSVRHQAEGIPHVLIATKAGPELPQAEDSTVDRSIYKDGKGDFRGYYHDGAYTAYPDGYGAEEDEEDPEAAQEGEDDSSEIKSEESSHTGPRNSNSAEILEAYYITLTQRYHSLRKILQASPPPAVVAALPSDHPTEVGGFGTSPSPFKTWSNRLRTTDPLPAQIASMHKDSVLRLLRIILNGNFFKRNLELRERTSRWMWALLARLPDKGLLDYQDIGLVRELGKRAVMFMLSLAEADVLREQYEVGGSEHSEAGDEAQGDYDVEENDNHDDEADKQFPVTKTDTSTASGHAVGRKTTASELVQVADDVPSPKSDVEMEIDSDEEEGEVSTESQSLKESAADVEMAKARLLAQLDSHTEDLEGVPDIADAAGKPMVASPGETNTPQDDEAARLDVNMRTTLNMILTVAGDFYGQRDLLEFRDPFGRIVDH